MTALKELFHNRPKSEAPLPNSEVYFKPIPQKYEGLGHNQLEDIEPINPEDAQKRLAKIENMLKAYEHDGLSVKQFAHFTQEMIEMIGGTAHMFQVDILKPESNENRQLQQKAFLDLGYGRVDFLSLSGQLKVPDIQVRLHTKVVDEVTNEDGQKNNVHATISENIGLHTQNQSSQPELNTDVHFTFPSLLPEGFDHKNAETKILNEYSLKKETNLNSQDLHRYAQDILELYKTPEQTNEEEFPQSA